MTSVRLPLRVTRIEAPRDIVAGLTAVPRSIPCKYFYDEVGAQLFEQICTLDEYYLTRTEMRILESHIDKISAWAGTSARVVELGSGSGVKTRLLLEHLRRPREYVPIDISYQQLLTNARALSHAYPGLIVSPLHADYTKRLRLQASRHVDRTIVFFPGSTIGNFEPLEAAAFLGRAADMAGPRGGLIVGVDLKKPTQILERAYNDESGVTAAFNLNVLAHVNTRSGGDFDASRFEHVAFYDDSRGRIEMHLRSRAAQTVTLRAARGGPLAIELAEGELIGTEHSYKYDVDEFLELARGAGFVWRHTWVDKDRRFSVHIFDVDR